ncbi:hypothetical protein PCANC_00889 [Puccinia coronata f. sp. avenae]|uniref:Uncharacterized protein n=1 Tax=Puccinia coronata f. sp. avenae TaxID=200324 RepID=A0A2N5W7E2_9BASI|nr:hypothetical protein PCANC_00889 [Puccinia coronata f. sp. avenae]
MGTQSHAPIEPDGHIDLLDQCKKTPGRYRGREAWSASCCPPRGWFEEGRPARQMRQPLDPMMEFFDDVEMVDCSNSQRDMFT